MDNTVLRQVLLTLSYCDQFDFPLTRSELWQRLLWNGQVYGLSYPDMLSGISLLKKKLVLEEVDGMLCLSGRSRLVQIRKKRHNLSEQKWQEAQKAAAYLHKIPWVSAVGITGALAMDNVVINDDIDFFVVTQSHRLWLVRPLVIILAFWKGKRRSWHKEEENSWCFNLWLEEANLAIPSNKKSLYIAYEVLQTKWLFAEKSTLNKYYQNNNWVEHYIPHYYRSAIKKRTTLHYLSSDIVPFFWSGCNIVLYWLQRLYMYSHQTNEKVSWSTAFFHPRDTKRIVYDRWKQSLERLRPSVE